MQKTYISLFEREGVLHELQTLNKDPKSNESDSMCNSFINEESNSQVQNFLQVLHMIAQDNGSESEAGQELEIMNRMLKRNKKNEPDYWGLIKERAETLQSEFEVQKVVLLNLILLERSMWYNHFTAMQRNGGENAKQ